jgi:hypothetical protein
MSEISILEQGRLLNIWMNGHGWPSAIWPARAFRKVEELVGANVNIVDVHQKFDPNQTVTDLKLIECGLYKELQPTLSDVICIDGDIMVVASMMNQCLPTIQMLTLLHHVGASWPSGGFDER